MPPRPTSSKSSKSSRTNPANDLALLEPKGSLSPGLSDVRVGRSAIISGVMCARREGDSSGGLSSGESGCDGGFGGGDIATDPRRDLGGRKKTASYVWITRIP